MSFREVPHEFHPPIQQESSPDLQVAERERKLVKVEILHNQALIFLRAERALEKGDKDAVEIEMKKLPEESRELFFSALEEQKDNEKIASFALSNLREYLVEKKQTVDLNLETPEDWGKAVFDLIFDEEPKGPVQFRQEKGYFIIICQDPVDYGKIFHLGTFRSDQVIDHANLSGGAYIGGKRFGLPKRIGQAKFSETGYLPNILLVKGESWGWKRIINHERQHYLNHNVFNKFIITEASDKHLSTKNRVTFRLIKDEVLAYTKDGSSGNDLRQSLLQGPLYNHLFLSLPTQEMSYAVDCVEAMADFLSDMQYNLSEETRSVLVYMLVQIPLEKFPQWLETIGYFFRERNKVHNVFFERFQESLEKIDFSFANAYSTDVFPTGVAEKILAVNDNLEDCFDKEALMRDEMMGILTGVEEKDLAKKLEAKLVEAEKKIAETNRKNGEILPQGVFPPHAQNKFHTKNQEGQKIISEIRQIILDTIYKIDQEEIDKIYNFLHKYGPDEDELFFLFSKEDMEKKIFDSISKIIAGLEGQVSVSFLPYSDAYSNFFCNIAIVTPKFSDDFEIVCHKRVKRQ